MYSTKVLEHIENPKNVGAMKDATARGEATNPVCGDLLHFYLKIVDGQIAEASFMAHGCPPTIAAASALTEMITGTTPERARALRPDDVTRALDYLPPNKEHCSILAIDALAAALPPLVPQQTGVI
jgi:nitrogen fixation protein NifU and related proteins